MIHSLTPAAAAFWREYRTHSPAVPAAPRFVFSFGDSPGLADELLALVLDGVKRATAGPLFEYAGQPDAMPRAGDYSVVLDGAEHPQCIVYTTDIRIGPLISVDDKFAWDEGEGDRSRTFWLRAHRAYVGRCAQRVGIAMHDGIDMVFERFTVVWPLAHADSAASLQA